MQQTNHFFDLGYGWLCKHCSAEDAERNRNSSEVHTGFFNHRKQDQGESKTSALALARWTDSTHHALTCPRCGIEETIAHA